MINQIRSEAGKKLSNEIQKAIDAGKGEVVLIVGKKGAGKSTFIERFFYQVLSKEVRKKCIHLNVDLAKFPGEEKIQNWITGEIKKQIFKAFYGKRSPTYDELQGIFIKDYDRWRSAEYAPLYETDKNQFKIEFGKYMAQQDRAEPYEYVVRLLEHCISARKKMPCIVFDNADQFPSEVQEELFQYSEALRRAISIVFVILPITDKTAWQHIKDGPLESYKSKSFWLPVPATKEIFKKRLDYIKYKLEKADKKSGIFTTPNGIKITLDNINAFAKCIEKIFIEKEYISKILGGLSNYNIRKCLELAHHAISSPHIGVEDLIAAYLHDGSLVMKSTKIKRAIFLGDYNFYKMQKKLAVFNLFDVDNKYLTSPLLHASILSLLLGKANNARDDIKEAYLTLNALETYFEPMSVSSNDVKRCCQVLLDWGLIEPYNLAESELYMNTEFAISYSGKLHIEMFIRDDIYICQMAVRTGIRDEIIANKIKEIYMNKMRAYKDWSEIKKIFLKYCLDEDASFINVPQHDDYKMQSVLRNDLSHDNIFARASEK